MNKLSRREWLGVTAAAGAVSCVRKVERPNILFVLADDQSWPHAGAYGAKQVATPAFDLVARDGILFRNSFAACPSCTPSRSAVLSGRNIWQQREAGVLYGSMPVELPLYTHLLEDAGYFVGYTGKGWAPGDWSALGLKRNPCGREFNSRKHAEAVPPGIDLRDYAANFTDFLAAKPADAPFCFWFGSTEPHRLYDKGRGARLGKKIADVNVPAFLPDTPEVRSDILDYYSEIDWFDAQLARVLKALDAAGLAGNTLVVVTSDNGMPFPHAKVNLYDWGTHMPLAMRWPGRIAPGQVRDDLVSHVDFAPTFLEAAGLTADTGMSGRSLLRPDASREAIFTGMERHTMCRPDGGTYPMRAIRMKRFLYIRNFAPDRWPTGGPDFISSNKQPHGDIDDGPVKAVITQPDAELKYPAAYRACIAKRPAEELYDVVTDPAQINNLAADPAQAVNVSRLRSRLEEYLRETRDPRIEGLDPWQGYTYHQTVGYGASFNNSLSQPKRDEAAGKATHKPE
ncbi:MAG: sulfatase [Bryobacteraceae bacterium]|nr:sulfatase [Bryobacteraceae bacterium]